MRIVKAIRLDAADFKDSSGPRTQANMTVEAFEASLDAHIVIDDAGDVIMNRSGPIGTIRTKRAA